MKRRTRNANTFTFQLESGGIGVNSGADDVKSSTIDINSRGDDDNT